MNPDRRMLLQLIAAGRITPREAERLSLAWNQARESAWIIALCAAAALLTQIHPQVVLPLLAHSAHALAPGSSLCRVLTAIAQTLGGLQ